MSERQVLVEALLTVLGPALREKAAKNEHKPPLSSLGWHELENGVDEESVEERKELYRVWRFGADPQEFIYEVADRLIYRAEQARRIGALPSCEKHYLGMLEE